MGISGLLNVYFNHTGHSRCFNSQEDATSDLGDLGWSYQVSCFLQDYRVIHRYI